MRFNEKRKGARCITSGVPGGCRSSASPRLARSTTLHRANPLWRRLQSDFGARSRGVPPPTRMLQASLEQPAELSAFNEPLAVQAWTGALSPSPRSAAIEANRAPSLQREGANGRTPHLQSLQSCTRIRRCSLGIALLRILGQHPRCGGRSAVLARCLLMTCDRRAEGSHPEISKAHMESAISRWCWGKEQMVEMATMCREAFLAPERLLPRAGLSDDSASEAVSAATRIL